MVDRRAELLRLLAEYAPEETDEQQYRLRMLDLAASAVDPFDRFSYAPGHFTASAFVLHPAGDRILLIHHAKLDIWVQPGGHIDPGDGAIIAAAAREAEEETGVAGLRPIVPGLVDVDIHDFPARPDQPFHRHFDLRFGFVAGGEALTESDEVHECRWACWDDLVAIGVDRSVLRPAARLLGSPP